MAPRKSSLRSSTPNQLRFLSRRTEESKRNSFIASDFSGYAPTAKCRDGLNDESRPGSVFYAHTLERDYICLLEDDPAVTAYTTRPASVSWRFGGKCISTTCEFAVRKGGSQWRLAAVKPKALIERYNLLALYALMRESAREQGYTDLQVLTEAEIRIQPRLANAELRQFQALPRSAHHRDVRFAQTKMATYALEAIGQPVSVGRLRHACGLGDTAYRAILGAIQEDMIDTEPEVLLDDHAIVRMKRIG